MNLNVFLGQLRREKRLSKAEIARKLDTSDAAWHGVENGRSAPRLATLIRIGELLDFEITLVTRTRAYYLAAEEGFIALKPADNCHQSRRQVELKALASLTSEQLAIVAQVAALLRP